jgi:hypothetical protein
MHAEADFETRIESLDAELFSRIRSLTSPNDRESLLAVQRAVRGLAGEYVYLEIGSYLGGSLQPHLLDPRCRRIYSIDRRTPEPPDARGRAVRYPGVTTRHMLELLGQLAPAGIRKLSCFEDDARNLNPRQIQDPPHLCFIDGEHTNEAAVSDFQFCLGVSRPDAAIALHDSNLIIDGIQAITRGLRQRGVRFAGAQLFGKVYLITLGTSKVLADPGVRRRMRNAALYFLRKRLEARWRRPGATPG